MYRQRCGGSSPFDGTISKKVFLKFEVPSVARDFGARIGRGCPTQRAFRCVGIDAADGLGHNKMRGKF